MVKHVSKNIDYEKVRNDFIKELYVSSLTTKKLLDKIDTLSKSAWESMNLSYSTQQKFSRINIFTGKVSPEMEILVDSVDRNFGHSVFRNILKIESPDKEISEQDLISLKKSLNQQDIINLCDIKFLSNQLKKHPSNTLLNLYMEIDEIGPVSLFPQVYIQSCPLQIRDKDYYLSLYGQMSFVHENTIAIELFRCEEIDERKKGVINFLQRYEYKAPKVKEFFDAVNKLDSCVKIRRRYGKRFEVEIVPFL
jgi:hypothetical protein